MIIGTPSPDGSVLEGVSSRGSVSPRNRRDFLLELQHDIGALAVELEAEGFSAEEAHSRACTLLLPDGESLERWSDVHASPYARLGRLLDERRLRRVERAVFAAVIAMAGVIGTGLVLKIEVMGDPSRFLWPVLASGVLLFAACLYHAALLWGRGQTARADRTLWWVLFLCAGTLAVAATGCLVDLIALLARLEEDPTDVARAFTGALRQDATLFAIALIQAMGGSVFWLVATQWIAISQDALTRAFLDTRRSILKEQIR